MMVPQERWQQLQTVTLPPGLRPLPPQHLQASSSAPARSGSSALAAAAADGPSPALDRQPLPQQLLLPHRPSGGGGASATGGRGGDGTAAGVEAGRPRRGSSYEPAAAGPVAVARRHDAAPTASGAQGQRGVAPHPGAPLLQPPLHLHPHAHLAQQQPPLQYHHQQQQQQPPQHRAAEEAVHSDLERLMCAVTPVLGDPGDEGPPLTLVRTPALPPARSCPCRRSAVSRLAGSAGRLLDTASGPHTWRAVWESRLGKQTAAS